jgi:hypothetical protein
MNTGASFLTLADIESQAGPVLVAGDEAGWWELFHDPLLDIAVLRLWLDGRPLDSAQLRLLAGQLVADVSAAARTMADSVLPSLCTVEVNRVFQIPGATPASVLLTFGRRRSQCGQCAWQQTGCDDWFAAQLAESFAVGCASTVGEVDRYQARRYVEEELAQVEGWQWWSLWTPAGRSGVVVSPGHEDLLDGRAYSQCVDAVGRHTGHLSCLAAELTQALGAELRGEVTLGSNWPRELAVLRRLHTDGWRIRGLTSAFPGPAQPGGVRLAATQFERR